MGNSNQNPESIEQKCEARCALGGFLIGVGLTTLILQTANFLFFMKYL